MAARSAQTLILGLLFVWSIAPGDSRLFAADDRSDNQPNDITLKPIPEGKSTLAQPQESDCLGLLESSKDLYPYEGKNADCDETEFCEEDDCGPSCRFWLRGDYLLLWTNGNRLPPLVTTSNVGDPVGVLGGPSTTVLFGNRRVNREGRSNFRVTLGYWLDCSQTSGWAGDYFDSRQQATSYSILSPGVPVLARPFFDVVNTVQSSQVNAYPGRVVGCKDIIKTDYYESAGAWWRHNLCCREQCSEPCSCGQADCTSCGAESCGAESCEDNCYGSVYNTRSFRLDVIAGYRYHRLADKLEIREDAVLANPALPVDVNATMFNIRESFRTTNEFNGGELGLLAVLQRGRWSFELLTKMALGNNHQVVMIEGSTDITLPGEATVSYVGGILALPTNIGRYARNEFVIIPQLSAEVGYQVTQGLRAYMGYNLVYWANVMHAGDQIDLGVNPSQYPPGNLVGPARPAFTFNAADFWAQGFTAGFEIRY